VLFSKHLPPGCPPFAGVKPGDPRYDEGIDQGFAIRGYGRVTVPPDDCERAQRGYRFLVVWLSGTGDRGAGGELRRATYVRLHHQAAKAYVRGSDGVRDAAYVGHTLESTAATRFVMYLAFVPPTTTRNFKLRWPGNRAIALGK
jgi:hypothetical protein